MLAEHVRPGTVRWGHKLVAATPLGGGTHGLEFANGVVADVDLVIGADGAWSKVRPLMSDAAPHYTGISYLDVHFEEPRPVPDCFASLRNVIMTPHIAGGSRKGILHEVAGR